MVNANEDVSSASEEDNELKIEGPPQLAQGDFENLPPARRAFTQYGNLVSTHNYKSLNPGQDELPLASYEYFQLVELLIFHVYLPHHGFSAALEHLKIIPLPKRIRVKFVERMT